MLSNSNAVAWKKSLFVRALFVLLTIHTFNVFAEEALPKQAEVPSTVASPVINSPHGYGGFGLLLDSQSYTSNLGDYSSSGAGMIFNGAATIPQSDGLGLGVTGSMGFSNLTDDNSTTTTSNFLFDVDAGLLLQELLYISLGVKSLSQTYDDTNINPSYTVIPVGVGMLSATDQGYVLTQFRFGGGNYSSDLSSDTTGVSFFGIKVVGQFGNQLQFMGGLEMDNYSFTDYDASDFYFRVFVGMGFGK